MRLLRAFSVARVQLVIPDADRDRFGRQARREGLSLSAWLRAAARERTERRQRSAPFSSRPDILPMRSFMSDYASLIRPTDLRTCETVKMNRGILVGAGEGRGGARKTGIGLTTREPMDDQEGTVIYCQSTVRRVRRVGHEKRRIDRSTVRSRQPVGLFRTLSERKRSPADRACGSSNGKRRS